MTYLKVGRRVRIINGGPYDGRLGTMTSTDGYIVSVEIDDVGTAPFCPTELEPAPLHRPRDFFAGPRRAGGEPLAAIAKSYAVSESMISRLRST